MSVLCSYKILNSHDIYKDTFIQVLHYIRYNIYIKLITLLYQTKIILISFLAAFIWIPAFSILRWFRSFKWTSLNVENSFSTPALDEEPSVSQSLWLWMPPGNGTNWIHYFWCKYVLVEWICLCFIVYYAGHQMRIVFQYMFHGRVSSTHKSLPLYRGSNRLAKK